jgi:hypothetical protein
MSSAPARATGGGSPSWQITLSLPSQTYWPSPHWPQLPPTSSSSAMHPPHALGEGQETAASPRPASFASSASASTTSASSRSASRSDADTSSAGARASIESVGSGAAASSYPLRRQLERKSSVSHAAHRSTFTRGRLPSARVWPYDERATYSLYDAYAEAAEKFSGLARSRPPVRPLVHAHAQITTSSVRRPRAKRFSPTAWADEPRRTWARSRCHSFLALVVMTLFHLNIITSMPWRAIARRRWRSPTKRPTSAQLLAWPGCDNRYPTHGSESKRTSKVASSMTTFTYQGRTKCTRRSRQSPGACHARAKLDR